MKNLEYLYGKEYFKNRNLNDTQRLQTFFNELEFINKISNINESILDVGCATGEFLHHIDWKGPKFGIEISRHAAKLAADSGIIIIDQEIPENSLDNVVYRGTIQHLDSPFRSLEKAYRSLKPGGMLFFLSTPNTSSICYKVFTNLPALDEKRNFYLPSVHSLKNVCEMIGFQFIRAEFPYLRSPYAKPLSDHRRFLANLILAMLGRRTKVDFAFWGNMMNLAFRKVK